MKSPTTTFIFAMPSWHRSCFWIDTKTNA